MEREDPPPTKSAAYIIDAIAGIKKTRIIQRFETKVKRESGTLVLFCRNPCEFSNILQCPHWGLKSNNTNNEASLMAYLDIAWIKKFLRNSQAIWSL